jgi:hypothetical protein
MLRGPEATFAAQKAWDQAGVVQNPEIWGVYGNYMQQPETLDQQMLLWHEMLSWDLVAAALGEMSEEAVQPDFVTGHHLWFECSDQKMEKKLMEMRDSLHIEELLLSQVWYVAGYGNDFERLHYEPGQGVIGMSFAHPIDVRRYWLQKNRACVGFLNKNETAVDGLNQLTISGNTFIRGTLPGGGSNPKNLSFPWDYLHLRRLQRSRVNEHGEPIFKEAQGVYKKLRLALDQMVVHRLQVQPDRYVVTVDTKDQPPAEAYRTVQRWKQELRKRLAFGAGQSQSNLTVQDFRAQYDPMALDTTLFLPQPRDSHHAIDKMQGTPQVPDVFDIELLMDLFFAIMGMPPSWLGNRSGGGQGEQAPASGKALLAQDMRFLRKTRSVRKPLVDGYTWLGYLHLLLSNEDVSQLQITTRMSDISSLEDQMRLELLNAQVDLLDRLGSALGQIGVPAHILVDLVFRRYMRLPDDVVNAVITALPQENPNPQQESVSDKAVKRIHEFVSSETHLTGQIRKLVEVLHQGDRQMRDFLNKRLRIEAMDRLPITKSVKLLTEARAAMADAKSTTVLVEQNFGDYGTTLPKSPIPASAGNPAWRGFYGG